MVLSSVSGVIVVLGIIFTIRIGETYFGEYILGKIGIGFNPILWMILIGVFLFLGDYLSKDIHPKLNKTLKSVFLGMIFLSIFVSLIL